jgi:hypothetical protein
MIFVAHQPAPAVLQPSKQPLHFPATFVPTTWAAILRLRPFAMRPVGGDQLDPYGGEGPVQGITIVGLLPD